VKAMVQETYGGPDVLRLREVDRPKVGDGDVLIGVRAAGVDQGVWHLMAGMPLLIRLGFGLRAPSVPIRDMDVAGVVEEVGREVTSFRPGDHVFGTCNGAFAEYAATKSDRLVAMPANLGFEQAAAVPTSGVTALQALGGGDGVQPREVLVIGAAGGVGSFAVQLAKVAGARVTGVCSTGKADLVRSLGADAVIDYTRAGLTGRYDLILDTAGNRPLSTLRKVLAPRGRLVIVGGEGGGRWLGGIDRQMRAQLLAPFVGQRMGTLFARPRPSDLEKLRELIEGGHVVPAVDRTFTLAEVPEAIRYLRDGRVRGKVVVTV
jgi:NADPH:quinone reductase-like Zn-dependent oxidoreductase